MDDLLTITQAATELGFHPNTVRNLIKSGKLPAYRIGVKIVRVKRSDLAGLYQKSEASNVR